MANPQQSLDQIKAQIESLKQQLGKTGLDVVNITDLTTAQTLLRGLQDEAADLATSFGDMASTLANIVGELSKSDTATKSATKAYKGLVSIAQKMQYEEQGIYAYNVKQLDNLHSQAKAQLINLQTSISRLTPAEQATAEGQALLKALQDQYAIENDLIKAIEKRLILEKKVEKTFGATGALIEGSSKLLSTMGFGHLSTELSELGDKLKAELRDELEKSGDEANKLALSFKYMGKGLAGSAKIFADGLTDPLFIVGKVLDTYLEINKASVDLQRLTGQNAVKFENIGANAATLKDTLETMSELTLRTGKNAQNIFSSKVIGQAAALKTTMGLTAEEAGGIAIMSQTSGKAVDDITDSVVATTSAFNGANRSAVSQGQVLRDVANTADSIKLSLGNNDVAIAKAASAARRLGMDLGRVDEIAGSLMNFEDSIGKELEAELLIGKELNLEKARELALNNDLAGLSEELFKNSSDIAEFGKMNRIQQESYAAALGMTKDELAKIAYQKALDNNMTEEQAAKAAGVNAEEMKRVDIQQNFAKALEKIAGALAPILDLVGDLLSVPLAPYILLGVAAVSKLGGGLMGTVRSMGSLARSTLDFVKNLNMKGVGAFFSGLKDKFGQLKGAFGEGFAGKIKEKAADAGGGITEKLSDKAQEKVGEKAEGLADKALGAGKEVPEKTGGGMSSLTESIQKIKPTQILAGAAALVLVAGAVFIFAKAAQEFATVSWEDMAKAGVGLLGLVAALAAVGAIMMSGVGALAILAGAAAIVIMAGGLFILGKALQEVGEGMQMMEPALSLVASIGDKAIGLMTVGASLMGIAAGLREIASAGTGAIPVLDKINTLAGGGNKSVGGAKGKEEGTMAALEAKFDTLIALVKQGTTINLDGSKIATSVNRNLPRVQTASS
jgi:hypothetical protein